MTAGMIDFARDVVNTLVPIWYDVAFVVCAPILGAIVWFATGRDRFAARSTVD